MSWLEQKTDALAVEIRSVSNGGMTLVEVLDRLMELWQLPWSEERYGEAQMLLSRIKAATPPSKKVAP